MSAYATLERRFERLSAIGHALSILSWDRSVMMPTGANAGRGDSMAGLEVMAHELLADPVVADLLAEAEAAPPDEPWARANLAEMRRAHIRATAVPAGLVGALAKATSRCEMTWRRARPAADFQALAAELAEVVSLTRATAAAKGEALGLDPYDALLDDYQPGVHRSHIDTIFAELAEALPQHLARIVERQVPPRKAAITFPAAQQRDLALDLMAKVGFDFEQGRLDESAHPFCGGNPDDIRMTTRWDERDVATGLMGVLHETGHALYEAGLPAAWRHQPVGRAGGMVLHESQSLLIEMQACRSPAFIGYLGHRLRLSFGDDTALGADNLLRLYHHVEPGLIRVDADEVTYPLHIVLRYRLEQDLIGGRIEVADLPEAWAAGMAELLGVKPPDDGVGCLQDIHWPVGAFGYFPSYSLGALLAAQLFQAAERAIPDLDTQLAKADFAPLLAWLRHHVHGRARSVPFEQLVEDATGAPLGTSAFLAHLDRRYGGS
ncbi:MAG: carboxypeptidase M32 [Geminicoccaceae bacterium]|nr:MAG: carboxypeptidase M32 [Geminicoccaceae bacterium]